MSPIAILLLLISASLHALWNFISKKRSPSPAFLLLANIQGALILLPFAVIYASQYRLFPPEVWLLVLVTGIFQALYYSSLANAYRAGDMSLAYPLARSVPVILVMLITAALEHGGQMGLYRPTGALLVVAGCLIMPMRNFSELLLKNDISRTALFALLAALGTTAYSIIDDKALDLLKASFAKTNSILTFAILYAFAEAVFSNIWLLFYVGIGVHIKRWRRAQILDFVKSEWRTALLVGIGIYLTYTLVLIAMPLTQNLAYLVGIRQLSIPIGVVLGIVFLKEPLYKTKIFGTAILLAGLFLIGIEPK